MQFVHFETMEMSKALCDDHIVQMLSVLLQECKYPADLAKAMYCMSGCSADLLQSQTPGGFTNDVARLLQKCCKYCMGSCVKIMHNDMCELHMYCCSCFWWDYQWCPLE